MKGERKGRELSDAQLITIRLSLSTQTFIPVALPVTEMQCRQDTLAHDQINLLVPSLTVIRTNLGISHDAPAARSDLDVRLRQEHAVGCRGDVHHLEALLLGGVLSGRG